MKLLIWVSHTFHYLLFKKLPSLTNINSQNLAPSSLPRPTSCFRVHAKYHEAWHVNQACNVHVCVCQITTMPLRCLEHREHLYTSPFRHAPWLWESVTCENCVSSSLVRCFPRSPRRWWEVSAGLSSLPALVTMPCINIPSSCRVPSSVQVVLFVTQTVCSSFICGLGSIQLVVHTTKFVRVTF